MDAKRPTDRLVALVRPPAGREFGKQLFGRLARLSPLHQLLEDAHWLRSRTPTSGSWLNLVEVFFGIITRQAIRRGTFASVKELVTAISRFIDGWNERCQPFIWTKTADQILPHAMRQRTSDAGH